MNWIVRITGWLADDQDGDPRQLAPRDDRLSRRRVGLLRSGSVLDGDTARALGLLAAGALTAFALLAVGLLAADMRSPRALLLHGAPAVLTAVAALAWWGALSL
jgi:hypothetical protein